MCQVLVYSMPEDIKRWLSPSVYHTLEWGQCMFHFAALDTVISMQVVVGSRPLKYERVRLGAGEAAQTGEWSHLIFMTWHSGENVLIVGARGVRVSFNTHAHSSLQDDPFLVFKSMKYFGFALSLCLLMCAFVLLCMQLPQSPHPLPIILYLPALQCQALTPTWLSIQLIKDCAVHFSHALPDSVL